MKQAGQFDYVVIDDDPLNNLICSKVIEITRPGEKVMTFNNARKGLDYITARLAGPEKTPVILFLNINMPDLSGWDVLDSLKETDRGAAAMLKIYMLSSSSFDDDVERAASYAIVTDYIGKPLTPAKLLKILQEI